MDTDRRENRRSDLIPTPDASKPGPGSQAPLHRNGSASQRVILVWWTMSGYLLHGSSPCPVYTCPASNVSVVPRVSGVGSASVRCPRVSCPRRPGQRRGGSWSELVAGRPLLGRPGEAGADRRACSGGDYGSGLGACRPGTGIRRGVASSRQPVTAGSGGTRPDPARAGGLGLLVGEECLASYQTLSWEWIGCGDYAQWSSREASGRAAWSLRAFPAGLRRELAAALRPQHAVSAARSKLTTP